MTDFSTVAYVTDGHERHQLDIFQPSPEARLGVAVLVFHGGAFQQGDRTAVHARCRALAARGVTAVAVGYRLLNDAPWPAPIEDSRAVVRWAAENRGALGGADTKIVLQGHSAGAQISLVTATTAGTDGAASPVDGVIAYFAPAAVGMTPGPGVVPAPVLFGPAATPEIAAEASPVTYLGPDFPPTVLVHGAADRFIAPAGSLRIFEELSKAGVRTELHLVAGQDHEFDMTPRFTESTTDVVVNFLRAEIVEADQAAKETAESNPFVSMPAPGGPPPA